MADDGETHNTSSIVQQWVVLYSDDLLRWALHKCSSWETAQDLVQDTFVAALESYHRFEEKSDPKTWLFAILNNKINDHYRSKYRKLDASDNVFLDDLFDEHGTWKRSERPQGWTDDAEHLMDDAEFRAKLEKCLADLPPHWQAAIVLRFIEERSGQQICQELGITDTNYWQILHRSKLQLRKCLESRWFGKQR